VLIQILQIGKERCVLPASVMSYINLIIKVCQERALQDQPSVWVLVLQNLLRHVCRTALNPQQEVVPDSGPETEDAIDASFILSGRVSSLNSSKFQ
jgi:hypothetical protein